ncbi:MAG: nucleotidyltransferase domain-containing protein [Chitinophagales bacterium]|nr:nucleotidyltransferase domain-containing protein [Bacteroidota bacterium]
MEINIQHIEEKIINALENEDVKAIYLYGSIITEYYNVESDIDIAVLFNQKKSAMQVFDVQVKLSSIFDRDIDLVQLDTVSTVLQFQVIQTGKRIFCKDEKFCNKYESQIFCDYVELNELRKPYLDEISKTGKVLR